MRVYAGALTRAAWPLYGNTVLLPVYGNTGLHSCLVVTSVPGMLEAMRAPCILGMKLAS
jgi:hypothetical protein